MLLMAITKKALFSLILFLLCATTVNAETNCSVTTVTVQDGGSGTIFSGMIWLMCGFAALFVMPKYFGIPNIDRTMASWKELVSDAWHRGIYVLTILVYWIAGFWLYQNAIDNSIEISWMTTMFSYLISIILFVILIYMMLCIVRDCLGMIHMYSESERLKRRLK